MISEAVNSVELDLEREGRKAGTLVVSCLPGKSEWQGNPAILDLRASSGASEGQSPVQLLEDIEYRFEAEFAADGLLTIEPTELFDADSPHGLQGRLRPGRHTGSVFVSLVDRTGLVVATCDFEVRSRKLGYMEEYRWMLERIADDAAETIMHRFSAGTHRFTPTTSGNPETIYQRFALIKAFLDSEQFENAVSLVLRRPHVEFVAETEQVHPSRGMRPGNALLKSLTGSGARIPTGSREVGGLDSLPVAVDRAVHLETIDTVPNRFVLHVLDSWRSTAASVRLALSGTQTPSALRGVREASAVEERLAAVIGSPLMQRVGLLDVFPAGNQVLQRREGYRDLFRAFLQGEVAANLEWSGGEDVFSAGLRDVAALYEYWVYFELARVIAEILGHPLDLSALFSVTDHEMSLNLKRGVDSELVGRTTRRNREIRLSLFFNRQYQSESWTESVRPDCSLELDMVGDGQGPTRLHFDAKYRVKELKEIIKGSDDGAVDPGDISADSPKEAQSQDLLKMHAYRDAVRRTVGAYVLYPGSDDNPQKNLPKYHEVLPGVGAFVLRPTSDGKGAGPGVTALAGFLEEVIDHLAARGTSRERSGFWEDISYEGWNRMEETRVDQVLPSRKPPADIPVLLGFVRNPQHEWIRRSGLYNLRADGRTGSVGLDSPELGVEIVILYNPSWDQVEVYEATGFVALRDRAQMIEDRYPNPRSDQYLCLELGSKLAKTGLSVADVVWLARIDGMPIGTPRVVSWLELQLVSKDSKPG